MSCYHLSQVYSLETVNSPDFLTFLTFNSLYFLYFICNTQCSIGFSIKQSIRYLSRRFTCKEMALGTAFVKGGQCVTRVGGEVTFEKYH